MKTRNESEARRIMIGILTVIALAIIIAVLMFLGILTVAMLLFNPLIFVLIAIVIVLAYYMNKERRN
jgi:4-hydroxybenzoate polyprenyltransferase